MVLMPSQMYMVSRQDGIEVVRVRDREVDGDTYLGHFHTKK